MILGDTCTRRCGFCNVKTGKPTWNDPLEPLRVARSVAPHGPAPRGHHLASTATTCPTTARRRLVRRDPLDPHAGAGVQGRVPDARLPRRGDAAGEGHRRAPRRLQPQRRGRAAAVPGRPPRLALGALAARAAQRQGDGRRRGRDQVRPDGRARRDARGDGRRVRPSCASRACQVLTVGQYLRPTERHLPVVRYWHPDEFKALEAAAYDLGFEHIAAGPLVRSSYHADEHVQAGEAGTAARRRTGRR